MSHQLVLGIFSVLLKPQVRFRKITVRDLESFRTCEQHFELKEVMLLPFGSHVRYVLRDPRVALRGIHR